MGRRFIIVDDKHSDDGYRREEMYRRMGGYRMHDGVRMGDYRDNEYDEGYRTGYQHGFKDHEQEEGWRRMRDSRGRYM
jgi:hypothetical protein